MRYFFLYDIHGRRPSQVIPTGSRHSSSMCREAILYHERNIRWQRLGAQIVHELYFPESPLLQVVVIAGDDESGLQSSAKSFEARKQSD